MKIKYMFLLITFLWYATFLYAKTEDNLWVDINGIEFRVQAGYTIGAVTPIPFPEEIRELRGYKPGFNMAFDIVAIKWITPVMGIALDLRLQNQGMETDAVVKSYKMRMTEDDGSLIEGYWTGSVATNMLQSVLGFSIPVLWKPHSAWELQLGPFFTWKLAGNFTGYVYDGYLRVGDPTGEKILFEGSTKGPYDFSDELNIFNWGIEVALMWQPLRSVLIRVGLTWGFLSNFDKEFETITFPMYPIYATLGFVHRF